MKFIRENKKILLLIVLLIGSGFFFLYGLSFAKYASNSIWNYYLKSKGFYFSSDYLGINTTNNVDNSWSGGRVYFNLKNSLNNSVTTDYNINYTVECEILGEASSHTNCEINGNNSQEEGILSSSNECIDNIDSTDVSALSKTACELAGYEWVSEIMEKELYFEVILTDQEYELNDLTVKITATATSPYHQVLTGTFKLKKADLNEENITLHYKNYANYDRLIISNYSPVDKCVKLSWDSSKLLIASSTDLFSTYLEDSSGYIYQVKLNVSSKESSNFIFYKRDFSQVYSSSDFLLEEDSDC